jgi:PST family polysaccharide transporter
MSISFLILTILVLSIQKISQYSEVYLLTFGIIIGFVLSPTWFFQGMERMKYITIFTIISKFIFTLSIFIFVHDKNDYLYVPFLNSLGTILAGIYSIYTIHKKFSIKFTFQKLNIIQHYFYDGWNIYVQRIYVSIYSSVNILILGYLTNNTYVGYYSIATRIIDIIKEIFGILSKVYYPYFTKKFISDPKKSFDNLKKISKIVLLLSFTAMLFMFIFGDYIVRMISGNNYNERITESLYILSFGIIFIPFFSLFTSTLVAIGESKILTIIAKNTAITSIILVVPLVWFFDEKGIAYLTLLLQLITIIGYFKIIMKTNHSFTYK